MLILRDCEAVFPSQFISSVVKGNVKLPANVTTVSVSEMNEKSFTFPRKSVSPF